MSLSSTNYNGVLVCVNFPSPPQSQKKSPITPVTSPNCFKETAKKQVYFLNICYLIAFLAYFTILYFNTKY